MPPTSGKIGDLHVELRADTAQFEAGMRRAEAVATNTSDKIETSLKKQVTAFTSVIGKVFAVISVFETFYTIGTKIGNLFRDLTPQVEAFVGAMDRASSESQLAALNKELADLQNQNQSTLESDLLNILQGQTSAQVRQKIALIESRREFISIKALREKNLEDAKKETAELRKQLDLLKQIQDQQRGRFSLYDVVFAVNANTEILKDIASRIR